VVNEQRQQAGDNAQQFFANRDNNVVINLHVTPAQAAEILQQRVSGALASAIANQVTQEVVRLEARALVHREIFLPQSPEYYFVKVVNLSQSEIQITHLWFDTDPVMHILNDARPLPTRLHPSETFETWAPVAALPDVPNIEQLGRVLLSSGQIIKSQPNVDVPPVGYVAGPASRE
jgi:hypothetical protein